MAFWFRFTTQLYSETYAAFLRTSPKLLSVAKMFIKHLLLLLMKPFVIKLEKYHAHFSSQCTAMEVTLLFANSRMCGLMVGHQGLVDQVWTSLIEKRSSGWWLTPLFSFYIFIWWNLYILLSHQVLKAAYNKQFSNSRIQIIKKALEFYYSSTKWARF